MDKIILQLRKADMEITPLKHVKPPGYPRKGEVDTEQIKSALPRRWMENRKAKEAFAALGLPAITALPYDADLKCESSLTADAGDIPISLENEVTATFFQSNVLSGVPEPGLPAWPFFLAAAGIAVIIAIIARCKKKTGQSGDNCEPPAKERQKYEGDY